MFRIYKVDGYILKRVNFGEADKIITVFTEFNGKLRVLGKGVRKLESRRAPHLELFNLTCITLSKGKNFDIITESELISPYPNFRKDIKKIASIYKISEIIDRLCPENEPYRNIFSIFRKILTQFEQETNRDIDKLVETATLEILLDLGYLDAETKLSGTALERFLEKITEKTIYSNKLLKKISSDSKQSH